MSVFGNHHSAAEARDVPSGSTGEKLPVQLPLLCWGPGHSLLGSLTTTQVLSLLRCHFALPYARLWLCLPPPEGTRV